MNRDGEAHQRLRDAYFSDHPHEEAIVSRLPLLLAGARTFVDVGASLGQYTFHANRILAGAQIVAIEADPSRFQALEESCREWARSSTNRIRAIHAAATDREQPQTFYVSGSDVSGGLFPHAVQGGRTVDWQPIQCPAVRLDGLFEGAAPDVVKIDVEGSELRVLRGAERLLRAGRTRFLVELHGWRDPDTGAGWRQVVAFMAAHGHLPAYFHGSVLFARPGVPLARALVSGLPSLLRRLARRPRRHE